MTTTRIRDIKISWDSIFFFGYVVIMLWPAYLSNTIFNFLDNLYLILGIGFLIIKRYKPSKLIGLVAIFYVYLILITFLNSTDTADVHLIISNLKVIIFLASIDCLIKRRIKLVLQVLFYYIFAVVLIDFVTVVMYPEGWYFTETVYNEWTTGYNAQWFLGNKNNHTTWYLLAIFLSGVMCLNSNKVYYYVITLIVSCISIISMILLDSATSIVVVIIAIFGMIWGCFRRKAIGRVPNIYFLIAIYVIFNIIILCGATSFLSPLVEGLLGRDLTFTSRTFIWERVFQLISQNIVFGSGQVSSDYASMVLGAHSFVNAHNQYLQILWQGGIVQLFIFVGIIFAVAHSIYHEKNRSLQFFKTLVILALLLKFIFEVEFSVNCWMILLLLRCSGKNILFAKKGVQNKVNAKSKPAIV